MRFQPTSIPGAFIVFPATHGDERGAFSRVFCQAAFAEAGIVFDPCQVNVSRNPLAGTLRGLHFQAPPHAEPKLVQCLRGQLWDVAVDLRPESPAYRRAVTVALGAGEGDKMFFIPAGCAHGFLTRAADTDLLYLMGAPYVAASARGVRWNDPAFAIAWPASPRVMSDRDRNYSDFQPEATLLPAADGIPEKQGFAT